MIQCSRTLLAGRKKGHEGKEGALVDPGQIPEAGFEILDRQEDGTLVVWLSLAITQAEFDALELPANWIKNQPRGDGGPDDTRFHGSPGIDRRGDGDRGALRS